MAEKELAHATLGGGCFWCLEAVFQRLKGVHSVTSGYAGGETENPDYRSVCSGRTGHAEVVQVAYDPEVIGFERLLEVFFTAHDPTQKNRQGNDVGTQYRSVILYHDAAQKQAAEQAIDRLEASGAFAAPVVTEVAPLARFYPAERYHQDYFNANPGQPYCQVIIGPKLEKVRAAFGHLMG
ncbi:peptide-methionine (S)-S-oxide reductase MsrA [Ectothiorhodospiraceae bacterium WFHF3C12]|nr:peptide-methionine (S)-S-oxide reductase MsrA [Ectothiorhodospiraceae bacterium WFHF3C12]